MTAYRGIESNGSIPSNAISVGRVRNPNCFKSLAQRKTIADEVSIKGSLVDRLGPTMHGVHITCINYNQ